MDNSRINEVNINNSEMKQIDYFVKACNSICKILVYDIKPYTGSGFFLKTRKENEDFYCLITCEHVITKDKIESKTTIIEVSYDNLNKTFEILLNEDMRFIRDYTYLGIDGSVIEILPEDKVDEKYFLKCNPDYLYSFENLQKRTIFVLQFPGGGPLKYSSGKIESIDKYSKEFTHKASTESGSSGSPIFLEDTTTVIGIHKQGNKKNNENYGNFIGIIINSLKENIPYSIAYKDDLNTKVFEGETLLKNDIFENNGKRFYDNDMYYIGKLINLSEFGEGIIYKKSGNNRNKDTIYYEGDFVDGKKEGKGKLFYDDGEYYIGDFLNDKRHGKGIIYYKDNMQKYKGDFENDVAKGKGELFQKNYYYFGDFNDGVPNGKGFLLIYEYNFTYEGDFVDGKFEGNGKLIYPNGNYYIGQFLDCKKYGNGILFSSDHKIIYEGEYVNGEYEGEGKVMMKSGDSYYIGEFKKGERSGHGEIYDKNGTIIMEGQFFKDKPEGSCKYFKGNKCCIFDVKNLKISNLKNC